MPLVSPDDTDDSGGEKEPPEDAPRGSPNNERLHPGPPEDVMVDLSEPPEKSDNGNLVAHPTKKVDGDRPKDQDTMRRLARADPQEAERILEEVREDEKVSKLEEKNKDLSERVNKLESRLDDLESAVSALVTQHDDVPITAYCDDCGSEMEMKGSIFEDNRLECSDCGRVEVGVKKQ